MSKAQAECNIPLIPSNFEKALIFCKFKTSLSVFYKYNV